MMINQKPLFPCCICYEDYSWDASELRIYNDDLWCENCWDETPMASDGIEWECLEKFVPEADRKIADLKKEIERLKGEIQEESVERAAAYQEGYADAKSEGGK